MRLKRDLLVSVAALLWLTTTGALHASAATPSRLDARQDATVAIELAQAFTAATNAHDVDMLVALFTDEDAGPTITADRSAWLKFEIALWAQLQNRMNVHVEAYDYRITEHGVAWDADVYRDDWALLGVTALPVTNSIWVHRGKLANFTSTPHHPHATQLLGDAWLAGAVPDRPPI
jgi:hypothetical protein